MKRSLRPGVVAGSPLRRVDPRVKLAMALSASLMVMLPLPRLAVFLAGYALFLGWARLLPTAAGQAWRLRWLLAVLFVLDAWLVSVELALAVCLRLALLAGVFALLVATTTPSELGLALEGLRLPYRYAFSLGLAFQSLGLVEDEWRAVQEAQAARGLAFALPSPRAGWGEFLRQARRLAALTVPVVVLATRRAWAITEAAYARGFDAPHRRPYRRLAMTWYDWGWLAATLLAAVLALWDFPWSRL